MAQLQTLLRRILVGSVVLFAIFLVASLVEGKVGLTRTRWMLALAATAVAAALAKVDLAFWRDRLTWKLACAAVGATAVALGWTVALIFVSELRDYGLSWRFWWWMSCVSVTVPHVLLLLNSARTPGILWTRRVTAVAAVTTAVLLVLNSLRTNVLMTPPDWLLWPLVVAASVSTLGSALLIIYGRPDGKVHPLLPTPFLKALGWTLGPLFIFSIGFYSGRVTQGPEGILETGGSALAALPDDVIDAQIAGDLGRLKIIVEGVERARAEAERLRVEVRGRMQAENRTVFKPEEDDAVRSVFFSYLSYRTALLRMVAFYQGFPQVPDRNRRARCFLLAWTAGSALYASSLSLVSAYEEDGLVRDKLNEPEPRWGIPPKMFDRIYGGVALQKNVELFKEMSAWFDEHRAEFQDCGFEPEDHAWMNRTIEHAVASVKANPLFGQGSPWRLIVERVREDTYRPVYAIQSVVSEWIGDTKLATRPPAISRAQIEEMREKLRPGDILLERRNWYLSNAFLPGFWPHAALYVGTWEDLERLGLKDDPAIRDRWKEFTTEHHGELKVVIEAISEGVSMTTLGESVRADFVAALRPRVGVDVIKQAILRAFSHQGKPYDFEFDFFSSDRLVCTEVVYRCYEGALRFDLVKIMGRNTLPAVEIARKFGRELGTERQELDFVFFLDAVDGGRKAEFRSAREFIESAERPRALTE